MHKLYITLVFTCMFCFWVNAKSPELNNKLFYKVHIPSIKSTNPPVLFLLHGYGSNEDDLLDLYKNLPQNLLVISVRAPYTIEEGSYKWYDVDFSTTERKMNIQQMQKSTEALKQLLVDTKKEFNYNSKEIYFGGFSQGGIMSYHMGLSMPEEIKGIIVMSGRLLELSKETVVDSKNYSNLKIFIAHGIQDQMIDISKAKEATAFLDSKSIKYTYLEFPMQHTIVSEELNSINEWIKN